MPAHPQPAAMTADEFRDILEAANLNQQGAADALGVGLATVQRWIQEQTPISQERAKLIRERLVGRAKK